MFMNPVWFPGIPKDPNGRHMRPVALECCRQNYCTCSACLIPFVCAVVVMNRQFLTIPQKLEFVISLNVCFHILSCGHPHSGLRNELMHVGCGRYGSLSCGYCEPVHVTASIRLECGHLMRFFCGVKVYQMASKVKKIELPECLYPGCDGMCRDLETLKRSGMCGIFSQTVGFCDESFCLVYERENNVCTACSRLLVETQHAIQSDDQMWYNCFWWHKPALFFCWKIAHFSP
jgi:hypothetical protein